MGISTDELLKKEVEAFRNGGKRYKNDYCNLRSDINEKSIDAAVTLAYHDAQRTMKGIGKRKTDKEEALKNIKKELRDYFSNPIPAAGFDTLHDRLCNIWCRKFDGSEIGAYGKAQKIINMSFKYLFCCDDAPGCVDNSKYIDHFKFCHMPLDSYTLEWYKRSSNNQKKTYTWSKMKKGDYTEIQDGIRIILNKTVDTPLEKEFKVWPEIQKERARK